MATIRSEIKRYYAKAIIYPCANDHLPPVRGGRAKNADYRQEYLTEAEIEKLAAAAGDSRNPLLGSRGRAKGDGREEVQSVSPN